MKEKLKELIKLSQRLVSDRILFGHRRGYMKDYQQTLEDIESVDAKINTLLDENEQTITNLVSTINHLNDLLTLRNTEISDLQQELSEMF